ncbi:hypothetical protein HDU92_000154 [Lobulomyces angularis]|nr:hypothetical protein HDU92_000154 [Lobulomyces angularis]
MKLTVLRVLLETFYRTYTYWNGKEFITAENTMIANGILIIAMEVNREIDKDLGYTKAIHIMFGGELAKKFNDIIYKDNAYISGDSMEDFILYDVQALYYDSLRDFLKIMGPPKIYAYWNGKEIITVENTIVENTVF